MATHTKLKQCVETMDGALLLLLFFETQYVVTKNELLLQLSAVLLSL